jgi:hypothetical protein
MDVRTNPNSATPVNPTVGSTIRRCRHDVYRPTTSRDSEPNPACTVCLYSIGQIQSQIAKTPASIKALAAEQEAEFVQAASQGDESEDVEELGFKFDREVLEEATD